MLAPFDFWQYWYNVDDRDVVRLLKLFTFLPDDEIARLGALHGAEVREAKRVLANEITRLTHGDEAARAAESGASGMVGANASEDLPTVALPSPTPLSAALALAGLAKSKSEARRLVEQGGVTLDGTRIDDAEHVLAPDAGGLVVRVGKKRVVRFVRET